MVGSAVELERGTPGDLLGEVLEAAGVGLCLLDPGGRVLVANDAWLRSSGYAREAALGRDIWELFPASPPELRRLHDEVRAGKAIDVPVHRQVLDGHEVWYEGRLAPVRLDGGVGILITALDITQRRQAEEQFRAMADGTPLLIWVTDPDARVAFVNRAYTEFFGVSREEVRSGGWQVLVHPEDEAAYVGAFLEALRERRPFHAAARVRRRDGAWRWVESFGQPRFSEPGEFLGMAGSSADITERRELEERARRQATDLQVVLDTVPAAVWIARDPRGDRIDANRFGAEVLRRPAGSNMSVSAPGDDRPQNFTARVGGAVVAPEDLPVQRAARTGEDVRGAETEVHFEDGTVRYLLGNATPLRDDEGRPRGAVGAFIDITTRKLAEAALVESDRNKTAFLAVLSHELRNPLAPIRNSIHLLERAAPDSDVARRSREVLRRQADHLTRLVDDLLDITRITHGKIELQRERLEAREVVRQALADARGVFEQRGVELLHADASEPLWVDADAARLGQMVGNLLHNALKFTRPGGQVRVRALRRGDGLEIRVRDSGIGIAAGDLQRIFEPFVQAGQGQVPHGGMGLGLALVRELCAQHGGTVHAESEGLGAGAEFVIALPLAPPQASVSAAPAAAPAEVPLSVLIVEDNADAAATLADILELEGHAVRTAGSGPAGIEEIVAAVPDVLLCDVGLPGMSGHEVIRAVRERPGARHVFAVALTGYAQPQDRAAALAAGFDAHLAKPPPITELRALLALAARGRAYR